MIRMFHCWKVITSGKPKILYQKLITLFTLSRIAKLILINVFRNFIDRRNVRYYFFQTSPWKRSSIFFHFSEFEGTPTIVSQMPPEMPPNEISEHIFVPLNIDVKRYFDQHNQTELVAGPRSISFSDLLNKCLIGNTGIGKVRPYAPPIIHMCSFPVTKNRCAWVFSAWLIVLTRRKMGILSAVFRITLNYQ